MKLALKALGSAIWQVATHFLFMAACNVIAILLSVPLLLLIGVLALGLQSVAVIPFGIVAVIGVLPNPASAGLQYTARELARGERVMFSDQWQGLREYWLVALRSWILSFGGSCIVFLNVFFYGRPSTEGGLFTIVEFMWLAALLFWLALHVYIYPLLFAQTEKRAFLTYRNALVIVVSRPLFTLTVMLVWLAVLIFCSASGLSAFLGLALGAAIQQTAAARVLPGLLSKANA